MSPEYLAFVTARPALDLSGNPLPEQESGGHEMQAFTKGGNKSSRKSLTILTVLLLCSFTSQEPVVKLQSPFSAPKGAFIRQHLRHA